MCGRFFVSKGFNIKLAEFAGKNGIDNAEDFAASEGDVRPSDMSAVIALESKKPVFRQMKWGFSSDFLKKSVINARAESLLEKKMFSEHAKNRRCVIPASGFYEWDPAGNCFRFTSGSRLVLLAGIYRNEADGEHYTIITTGANSSMSPVHDRMPVMIEYEELPDWLGGSFGKYLSRKQRELERKADRVQLGFDMRFE